MVFIPIRPSEIGVAFIPIKLSKVGGAFIPIRLKEVGVAFIPIRVNKVGVAFTPIRRNEVGVAYSPVFGAHVADDIETINASSICSSPRDRWSVRGDRVKGRFLERFVNHRA